MNKGKLEALINLLDDPDQTVFELVEKELLKESDEIIPVLEEKWETSLDINYQERIENLILFFNPEANSKGLELIYENVCVSSLIRTDENKLNSILSNPTTLSCSGTAIPCCRQAFSKPMAVVSL